MFRNSQIKNIVQSQGFKDMIIVGIDTPFKGIIIIKKEGN